MSKEKRILTLRPIENISRTDPFKEQLAFAIQNAELGLINEISKDTCPDLATEQPDLFNLLKIEALGSKVEQLMAIKGLVQVDFDARTKIKAEVSRLMNDAAEIVNSWLENGEPEENIQVPFLFGRNEAQSFDAAINLGLVNLINEVNFPFLAAIHKDDILRFKLMSISTALNHWEKIEASSEGKTGFEIEPEEISNLNEFANKKVKELQEMKEELLTKRESSE
jgi:hypothetical protein